MMFIKFALALLLAVAVSALPAVENSAVKCGVAPLAPKVASTIVGGGEVSPHEYPWQVAIQINHNIFCGGSIISDQWIVTAAHCVDKAYNVQVILGAHSIQKFDSNVKVMTSNNYFAHEKWNTDLTHNDIGLIKMPQRITFNNYMQPVCLPKSGSADLSSGVMVTPTGWGLTSWGDEAQMSQVLKSVTVPTITNTKCRKTYGWPLNNDQMCTDSHGPKSVCSGDSGGPLNHKVGSKTEIRGINSFVHYSGCETGMPNGYTRISHFVDWIKTNTGISQ